MERKNVYKPEDTLSTDGRRYISTVTDVSFDLFVSVYVKKQNE